LAKTKNKFTEIAVVYTLCFKSKKSTLRAIGLMVFDSNPFEPVTLFSTAKNRVTRKMPQLLKVLNRKKWLILASRNIVPSGFRSNGFLAICP
jgi:hypothetical protein